MHLGCVVHNQVLERLCLQQRLITVRLQHYIEIQASKGSDCK